jgi:micrococcal nuclease
MKNILLFLCFISLSTCTAGKDLVKVTRVIDGDTIEVLFVNGRTDRVRFLGIDCPESLKVNNPDEYEGISNIEYLHHWAVYIKEYTRSRLLDKQVFLKYDSVAGRRGYFDRLLAYIIIDGTNVNTELVRQGFARVYTEAPCELMSELLAAQEEAVVAKRGIWSGAVAKTEIIRNTFLIATDVHYDAEGNDNKNLNDEYFALKNISKKDLDLSGWILSDAKGNHSYTFSPGFILQPQQKVYIYSGEGRDTGEKLYWNSSGAIWNNTGDKIYILDPGGEIYELYSWK